MKTIAIIIQRGLGVQGPGPDFAHLEGTVAVDVAFGYALVLEGRARGARGSRRTAGGPRGVAPAQRRHVGDGVAGRLLSHRRPETACRISPG